jgi:regulation of enolase protein 1 (concanavalin A-like superfamily)
VATVSLKANNGGYLSWQSASPYTLTCEATSETANAQFTLVDAGAGCTALRASNGKYVRYSASDNKLYADATTLGSDEQFSLNRLNRSVAIRGPNSLFLTQNANDPVLCSKSILAGWEYFMVTTLSATQGPPAIPLGVAISGGTVSWKSMLSATHYSVQRRTSSGGSSFQTIATDISATSFTDPSPTSGATNSYRIISHAGTYTSQPSAEVGFVFSGLPAGWNQQDIGTVGLAGTTTFSGSAITLQGSGADIWETADGCHFLSQGISGDFVITVRLASMSNTDYWAKAGLMVRETNAAGSKNVSLLVTPESGGTRMQWRISGDGDTSDHRLSLSNAPRWLRILRSGNTFIGWQSEDGATWTDQHTVTFPMNAAVQVGLAVTSHKNDTLNTATFQNVDIIALPSGTSSWSSFQNHWFTAQQIADVNLSSPSADANRDGFANLFSYGSGLSPLTSMSGISNPYPVILDSGGFLSITFPRLKNRLDYDFVVEVSSDLVTWNSGPVYTLETSVTPLDATREQVTVRDLTSMNASSRRFIRLKAIYGF